MASLLAHDQGALALSLVSDLLDWAQLVKTSSILHPELGQGVADSLPNRDETRTRLHALASTSRTDSGSDDTADNGTPTYPLLLTLLASLAETKPKSTSTPTPTPTPPSMSMSSPSSSPSPRKAPATPSPPRPVTAVPTPPPSHPHNGTDSEDEYADDDFEGDDLDQDQGDPVASRAHTTPPRSTPPRVAVQDMTLDESLMEEIESLEEEDGEDGEEAGVKAAPGVKPGQIPVITSPARGSLPAILPRRGNISHASPPSAKKETEPSATGPISPTSPTAGKDQGQDDLMAEEVSRDAGAFGLEFSDVADGTWDEEAMLAVEKL